MDNLKEAIAMDIETLKQIEVVVMASSLYYKKVKQWVIGIFLLLFLLFFYCCCSPVVRGCDFDGWCFRCSCCL